MTLLRDKLQLVTDVWPMTRYGHFDPRDAKLNDFLAGKLIVVIDEPFIYKKEKVHPSECLHPWQFRSFQQKFQAPHYLIAQSTATEYDAIKSSIGNSKSHLDLDSMHFDSVKAFTQHILEMKENHMFRSSSDGNWDENSDPYKREHVVSVISSDTSSKTVDKAVSDVKKFFRLQCSELTCFIKVTHHKSPDVFDKKCCSTRYTVATLKVFIRPANISKDPQVNVVNDKTNDTTISKKSIMAYTVCRSLHPSMKIKTLSKLLKSNSEHVETMVCATRDSIIHEFHLLLNKRSIPVPLEVQNEYLPTLNALLSHETIIEDFSNYHDKDVLKHIPASLESVCGSKELNVVVAVFGRRKKVQNLAKKCGKVVVEKFGLNGNLCSLQKKKYADNLSASGRNIYGRFSDHGFQTFDSGEKFDGLKFRFHEQKSVKDLANFDDEERDMFMQDFIQRFREGTIADQALAVSTPKATKMKRQQSQKIRVASILEPNVGSIFGGPAVSTVVEAETIEEVGDGAGVGSIFG